MAEPATVLAIVAGLAKTAILCFQIIRKTHKAPDEIKRLNGAVANWRPQLESLAELLEGDSQSANRLREKFVDGVLHDANDLIAELNRVLGQFQKPSSLMQKFHWSATARDQVKDLLEQVERDMGVILGNLQIETHISLIGLQKEIRNIQLSETNEHERRNILQWLKPEGIDAHEFHRQKQALRERGTCDWLANSGPWLDWCEGGSPDNARFLWIHGLPGAGKTVLASFAIDHVISKYQHTGVSYYYCSHERQKQGHTSSQEACLFLRWVIRDLTSQVTRPKTPGSNSQPMIPKKLEELYANHDFGVQSLLECLLIVTEYMTRQLEQQICIIVDAVDESPSPRDALLSVLTTIGSNPEWQHVSLCFTSRKETDIHKAIDATQPEQPAKQPLTPKTQSGPHGPILSPKGPSGKVKKHGLNLSGFDGGSPSSHSMLPPPSPSGTAWQRGRNPAGGASQRTSRSEIRAPSGDLTFQQNERVRSTSMKPAEESHGFDPMDIDSADYPLPVSRMGGCTILSMDENPDVKEAIRTFVRSQLQANEMCGPTDGGLEEIINLIARRAKGMFRWAACQVDIIIRSNLRDMDSISDLLDEIPPDIFGTYEHMIAKMLPDGRGQNEYNRNFARTALALICSPSASVPCAEVLVEASRFDVPHGSAHRFDLDHLEKILGCLVTVSPLLRRPESMYARGKAGEPGEGAGVKKQVSVAHYTVKEYLFDKSTALSNVKEFALSKEFIQNLELQVIFSGIQQWGSNRHNEARSPSRFEEYCVKMTEKALQERERRDAIVQDKTIWRAVTECLKWNSKHNLPRSGAFQSAQIRANCPNWVKTFPFERDQEPDIPETSVLVSLILLKWPELAKLYLADLSEPTRRKIWKDTFELKKSFRTEGTDPFSVMQLCVTRRDITFLQVLIDSRADFSNDRHLVMDLFHHAYGHKTLDDEDGGAKTGKMLKMLLERGMRIEAVGYVFTPLQFAVSNLEHGWVHALLIEHANPNATGKADGMNPASGIKDDLNPFTGEQMKDKGQLTPLKICEVTTSTWLMTDTGDKELMEDARERVDFLLRQWGAKDVVVVDSN